MDKINLNPVVIFYDNGSRSSKKRFLAGFEGWKNNLGQTANRGRKRGLRSN